MKVRLHRLEIRNFKAFREPFILDLESRHLLVYGSNGSGKSSLYWALYTFLQSANKTTDGVSKYFDPANEERLIQKAEEYLHGYKLDEAALCLRKAAEDTAKRFIDHNEVLPTKDFVGLAEALRAARNKIHAELPVELYEKVVRNTPDAHRHLLIASNDADLDGNVALNAATKGRLKTNRNRLRKLISSEHVDRLKKVKLIDDILACTERVLNPAAHSGTPPLYKKEVQDALDLIAQLEKCLP